MNRPEDDEPSRLVDLPGSRTLRIRPVNTGDEAGLVALYEGLSEEDRHCRFFTSSGPPRRVVEKLTRIEERGGFGLVAVIEEPDGSRHLVGEASCGLLPNGNGDLGITVAEEARGWLGPYLLDALVEQAASRGVPNIEAHVLFVNRRMLTLLRRRGLVYLGQDDPSIFHVAIGTEGRVPTWPAGHERPRLLVEVSGGRWRVEKAARSAGFEVIACPGPLADRSRCPALRGERCPLVAGADVVVDAVPDETGRLLSKAHQHMFPGVPICVELPNGDSTNDEPVQRISRRDAETVVIGVLQSLVRSRDDSRPEER